jgi:hypothetical protein
VDSILKNSQSYNKEGSKNKKSAAPSQPEADEDSKSNEASKAKII